MGGEHTAMPETSDIPVTTAQLTASLAGRTHAAAKGGITDPATISALTASLATTAYRLPQLLNTISGWLRAETTADRIADDHRRSPDQLTARIRAAIAHTADNAEELAAALAAVHNLTATLHTAEPAAREIRTKQSADLPASYDPEPPLT